MQRGWSHHGSPGQQQQVQQPWSLNRNQLRQRAWRHSLLQEAWSHPLQRQALRLGPPREQASPWMKTKVPPTLFEPPVWVLLLLLLMLLLLPLLPLLPLPQAHGLRERLDL